MVRKGLVQCAASCVAVVMTVAVWADGEKTVTVARFEKPPVIDGKMTPGEWDRAVATSGFEGIAGAEDGLLDARRGRSYVGFTDERLYIAVVSEMPPDGKIYADQTKRDADVIWDEGIEIWLDPNRERRESKQGDQSFYQLIGNAIGTIYDVRFDPNKGAPDIGWNGSWEFGNSVDAVAHMWTAELSIPFTDLGWEKGKVLGRPIGVLIARNFKRPWSQVTWFRHRGAFVSWTEYPVLMLTTDKPTVQIASLGENLHKGQLELAVRIVNPGPAREAKVKVKAVSSDMPEMGDEKVVALPAKGEAAYGFKIPPGRFREEARHGFVLTVTDAKAGEQWFTYNTEWTKAPERRWQVRIGPDPDAAVRLAYYPSYNFIRVRVDTRELEKESEAIRSATVTLTGKDGKELQKETMKWEAAPAVQEFKVADLPDGDYTVRVALDGYKAPFDRAFKRTHFPWEGNKLGITNKVYPPFEPIKVAGNEVAVALRRYKVNGAGLWDSVMSLDRELLAAPMALKVDDGQAIVGEGKFTSTAGHAVVYEGQAKHPAVMLRTRCTTEYDGCMKVELDLLPGAEKKELKALWLDIPLRDRQMPLWHVSTTGLRTNPAGNTPKGEGDVWDSRKYPDGNWYGNFKCYVWLGGEERGLCWFADNDQGWVLDVAKEHEAPCLVLNRKGDVLTLRVNLVQKPVTIEEPRKIVFGLMASPAKPLPKDWRRIGFEGQAQPGSRNIVWMGSQYWGSDTSFAAKYPRNGDMSVLTKMQEARLTGSTGDVQSFLRIWTERNLAPDQKVLDKKAEEMLHLIEWSIRQASTAGPNALYCVYWEEFHSTFYGHPEMSVFGAEWTGNWTSGTGALTPSYRDFAVWYGAEFIRRGIGLYFDNAFPKRAYCPVTTSAYRLPDGTMQPSAGMWAHREYLKRIWVLHRQLTPAETPTLMMIHMTNTHLIPLYSFNDSNLDLEWFYGPEPQQSKYPHDLLRAESLGRQSGNIPLVLANVDKAKSKEEQALAERTRFGAMMVHEIKARWFPQPLMDALLGFGYGLDDCQVFNYWDENYPLKTSDDEQVKSLLLKRGNELMVVLCTWNPRPATVTLTFDSKALGLKLASAADCETNEALKVEGDKVTVPLAGYGVRMLRAK